MSKTIIYTKDQLVAKFTLRWMISEDINQNSNINIDHTVAEHLAIQAIEEFNEFYKVCDNTSKFTQLRSLANYFEQSNKYA